MRAYEEQKRTKYNHTKAPQIPATHSFQNEKKYKKIPRAAGHPSSQPLETSKNSLHLPALPAPRGYFLIFPPSTRTQAATLPQRPQIFRPATSPFRPTASPFLPLTPECDEVPLPGPSAAASSPRSLEAHGARPLDLLSPSASPGEARRPSAPLIFPSGYEQFWTYFISFFHL